MAMKSLFYFAVIAVTLLSTGARAAQQINTLDKSGWSGYQQTGVAIRGYDTVAYFLLAKAVKGSDAFSTHWNGADWYFSSDKHRTLFERNPQQYAPQYGGYCAYGVALGELLKIEGEQWMIHDGKLYLNHSRKWLKKWNRDLEQNIRLADQRYSELAKLSY